MRYCVSVKLMKTSDQLKLEEDLVSLSDGYMEIAMGLEETAPISSEMVMILGGVVRGQLELCKQLVAFLEEREMERNRQYEEWKNDPKCEKCGKLYPCDCEIEYDNDAKCPHGNDPANCDHCDFLGDIAYDTWRENR